MWLGDGDGSAHAATTRAVEMQMISKLCSTLSILENKYCSVENRCSVLTFGSSLWRDFESGRQEGGTRCPQRVELGLLPSAWGPADPPLDFPVFLLFWLAPALLSQRRCHFGSRRGFKLERRRRNRRTRLVRIRGDDPIAVRQQHVGAFDSELVVDSQIQLLKHSFHRPSAREQCKLMSSVALGGGDVEAGFDIFQIERGVNRRHRGIQRRFFA